MNSHFPHHPNVNAILKAVAAIDQATIEYCETGDADCLQLARKNAEELQRYLGYEIQKPTFQPKSFLTR